MLSFMAYVIAYLLVHHILYSILELSTPKLPSTLPSAEPLDEALVASCPRHGFPRAARCFGVASLGFLALASAKK